MSSPPVILRDDVGIVPYGKNQRCNNDVGADALIRPLGNQMISDEAGTFLSYLRLAIISTLVILRDDVGIVPYGLNRRCNNDVGADAHIRPIGNHLISDEAGTFPNRKNLTEGIIPCRRDDHWSSAGRSVSPLSAVGYVITARHSAGRCGHRPLWKKPTLQQ